MLHALLELFPRQEPLNVPNADQDPCLPLNLPSLAPSVLKEVLKLTELLAGDANQELLLQKDQPRHQIV